MGNKSTIGLLVVITTLVFIVVVSTQRIIFLEEQEKLDLQSYEMLTLVSDLHAMSVDAETDEQAYINTHEEHIRQRFNHTLNKMAVLNSKLGKISVYPAGLKNQITAFRETVAKHMSLLQSLTDMQQAKGADTSKPVQADNEVKNLRNRIDALVTQIAIAEARQLNIAHVKNSRKLYFSSLSLFLGSLILVFLIVAVFLVNRSYRRRKRAENELSVSENKLRILFELLPVGISVLNAQKKITYLNPALEKILDINMSDLLKGDYHNRQYLNADGEIMHKSGFASEIADRENSIVHNIETGVVKENGQVIWTTVSAVPVAFHDWHTILVTTDITERKLREEKLEQLAAIVESSENIILGKDLEGIITSWNKGAEHTYGYTAAEVIGKPLLIVSPPGLEDEIKELLETIKNGSFINHFETLRKTKSGEIIHVSLSISPIRNRFGKVTGASTIGHNITARKLMEAELVHKNIELIRLNIEKDKFLSIIAHDLRSPFNVFLGYTTLLDEELSTFSKQEIQEFASNMRKSADKLFLFLENLLEWSRIQLGSGIPSFESFALSAEIKACVEIIGDVAVKKSIEIKQNIPDGISITADKQMFRSLIRNLVFNAIKFTPRDGTITISAQLKPDKSTEISISDTGIGISSKMLGLLFQHEQCVNRRGTENEPSTGLGLIICKEYVEKHGGKIWAESTVGSGSTFYFTIPYISSSK